MSEDIFKGIDGRNYELRNLRVQQSEKAHTLHFRVGNGAYSELPHHEIQALHDFLGQWVKENRPPWALEGFETVCADCGRDLWVSGERREDGEYVHDRKALCAPKKEEA